MENDNTLTEKKRSGTLIGAYVAPQLKASLKARAKANHRTLSQELIAILRDALEPATGETGSLDEFKASLIRQIQGFQPSAGYVD